MSTVWPPATTLLLKRMLQESFSRICWINFYFPTTTTKKPTKSLELHKNGRRNLFVFAHLFNDLPQNEACNGMKFLGLSKCCFPEIFRWVVSEHSQPFFWIFGQQLDQTHTETLGALFPTHRPICEITGGGETAFGRMDSAPRVHERWNLKGECYGLGWDFCTKRTSRSWVTDLAYCRGWTQRTLMTLMTLFVSFCWFWNDSIISWRHLPSKEIFLLQVACWTQQIEPRTWDWISATCQIFDPNMQQKAANLYHENPWYQRLKHTKDFYTSTTWQGLWLAM